MSRREALDRARTAAGLEALPEVAGALAEGRITHGHAQALTHRRRRRGHRTYPLRRITHGHAQALTQVAVPPEVDLNIDPDVDFPTTARRIAETARDEQHELIRAGEAMSVEEYRRFLRRWADRAADDDGAERDLRQRRRRSVTTFDGDAGMHGVRALLPAEQFAVFENELRRLAEVRWRAEHPDADGVAASQLSCPQRNADALVDMARRSRELAGNNGEPLGSHVEVMVLIDAETVQRGLHEGSRCEFDDTTPISPVTARRLLCDADILTAAMDRTSLKLDVGYSRRAAGVSIRSARPSVCRSAVCGGKSAHRCETASPGMVWS